MQEAYAPPCKEYTFLPCLQFVEASQATVLLKEREPESLAVFIFVPCCSAYWLSHSPQEDSFEGQLWMMPLQSTVSANSQTSSWKYPMLDLRP
jgi:hypothetical protein